MSTSRIALVSLVAVVCMAAPTLPVMADLIVNGNFESVDAGVFTGWTYSNTSGTATASTTPTVLDGIYSARVLYGSTNGGFLDQTVSSSGLSDFIINLDFAVLDISTINNRTLGIRSNNDTANVCIYYTANGAQLRFYNGSGFIPTNLYANTTDDLGTVGSFGDGEIPTMNHLTLVGENYGTSEATLTITLNGSTPFVGTSSASLTQMLTTFGFFGIYRNADFLVDNVSLDIPEPSALILLVGGLFVLLFRRRRK